ncbi:phage minor head protein [Nocardiopsis lucentensis]|uniref:phage minor head protein n=1 Tax=Nocardiopsis lucentensis TaxID=53441 RepID=UPI0003451A32|nr:phage minor head protein [Nocardiopsis lucentensis]
MTTPLPPEPDDTTPELDQLETRTRAAIDRHLRPARREAERRATTPTDITRRNQRVIQRLRQARAALTDTANQAVHDAVRIGVNDAQQEAPPPGEDDPRHGRGGFNPHVEDHTVHDLTSDMDLRQDVRFIITAQGTRIETGPPEPNIVQRVAQTAERLWNTITTRITDAFNRGRRWYAQLFAYELKWFTRADERVCPICRPLNGKVIASGRGFSSDTADWQGIGGQPPAHWRCRCYTQVIQTGPLGRALRRR